MLSSAYKGGGASGEPQYNGLKKVSDTFFHIHLVVDSFIFDGSWFLGWLISTDGRLQIIPLNKDFNLFTAEYYIISSIYIYKESFQPTFGTLPVKYKNNLNQSFYQMKRLRAL